MGGNCNEESCIFILFSFNLKTWLFLTAMKSSLLDQSNRRRTSVLLSHVPFGSKSIFVISRSVSSLRSVRLILQSIPAFGEMIFWSPTRTPSTVKIIIFGDDAPGDKIV